MRLAIIGGQLQGTEAAYLSRAAGFETIVIDKKEHAQAFGLSDKRYVFDVLAEPERLQEIMEQADVVLPALENREVLDLVEKIRPNISTPVIFDMNAYNISSSKERSNQLFKLLNLKLPMDYPVCRYPVIVKPDDMSGSQGVIKAYSKEEVNDILSKMSGKPIIQEFLEGRSFSLEVLGDGENFYYPQITEVVMDKDYDAKRIIAPAKVSEDEERQMYEIGKTLANALKIKGIFDIEVISDKGQCKLLEIDARIPSQTPVSVYHSCGINMVEVLVKLALKQEILIDKKIPQKVCYYQQIVVSKENIKVLGEHVMENCKELCYKKGFFGADFALTDYRDDEQEFSAIVVVTDENYEDAYTRFLRCINNIRDYFKAYDLEFVES